MLAFSTVPEEENHHVPAPMTDDHGLVEDLPAHAQPKPGESRPDGITVTSHRSSRGANKDFRRFDLKSAKSLQAQKENKYDRARFGGTIVIAASALGTASR